MDQGLVGLRHRKAILPRPARGNPPPGEVQTVIAPRRLPKGRRYRNGGPSMGLAGNRGWTKRRYARRPRMARRLYFAECWLNELYRRGIRLAWAEEGPAATVFLNGNGGGIEMLPAMVGGYGRDIAQVAASWTSWEPQI